MERGDEHRVVQVAGPNQLDHARGAPVLGVEVGVVGGVLHLDVHEHPGADVEHLVEGRDRRTRRADLGEVVLGQDPEPVDRGVVVDDERAVGGAVHVELDPVRALVPGFDERGECVLDRVARCPAVAEHERTRFRLRSRAERRHPAKDARNRRSDPLQRVLVPS